MVFRRPSVLFSLHCLLFLDPETAWIKSTSDTSSILRFFPSSLLSGLLAIHLVFTVRSAMFLFSGRLPLLICSPIEWNAIQLCLQIQQPIFHPFPDVLREEHCWPLAEKGLDEIARLEQVDFVTRRKRNPREKAHQEMRGVSAGHQIERPHLYLR